MLGKTHALSGLAVGIQASPVVVTAPAQLQFVAVVAGCALAPDLDMAQSTIGRMWGPLTGGVYVKPFGKRRLILPGLSHLVEFLAGGHRRGTHSIDGLLLLLLAVWGSQFWSVAAGFVTALLVGVAILAADFLIPGKIGWGINLAASAAAGYWVATSGFHLPGWTPWAMALGCAVHIVGDMLTIQGCPLVILGNHKKNARILPLITGGPTEKIVITGALFVWIGWTLALRINPTFPTPWEAWQATGWSWIWLVVGGVFLVSAMWAWAAGFDERRELSKKKRDTKAKKSGRPRADTPV